MLKCGKITRVLEMRQCITHPNPRPLVILSDTHALVQHTLPSNVTGVFFITFPIKNNEKTRIQSTLA